MVLIIEYWFSLLSFIGYDCLVLITEFNWFWFWVYLLLDYPDNWFWLLDFRLWLLDYWLLLWLLVLSTKCNWFWLFLFFIIGLLNSIYLWIWHLLLALNLVMTTMFLIIWVHTFLDTFFLGFSCCIWNTDLTPSFFLVVTLYLEYLHVGLHVGLGNESLVVEMLLVLMLAWVMSPSFVDHLCDEAIG